MGWYMIGGIVLNGMVNILVILWFGGKSIVLLCVKYYRRIKFKVFGPERREPIEEENQLVVLAPAIDGTLHVIEEEKEGEDEEEEKKE